MMGSLRSRHLLNGIAIIITGILVLGVLLSLNIYQSRTEAVGEELERTALDLLGYIEYDNGKFLITEPNRAESESFIHERGLITSGKKRFAYIWDRAQQKIIWDSLDNDDVDQQSVNDNFVLFDFEAILKDAPGNDFEPAQAKKMYSIPAQDGEEPVQYLVAAQKFALKIGGDRQDYLFVVATSIADIETGIYGLIRVLALLLFITFVLLVIAQLLFSYWVIAPIRKLEREMFDIERGSKAQLDNDYPSELKSIKKAINKVLSRNS